MSGRVGRVLERAKAATSRLRDGVPAPEDMDVFAEAGRFAGNVSAADAFKADSLESKLAMAFVCGAFYERQRSADMKGGGK